ncbi:MAG: LiaF transmembrane domain-containing protein [Flavobacteriales bacterium]
MTINEEKSPEQYDAANWQGVQRRGRLIGGLAVVMAGVLFLIREINHDLIPEWVFTWQMLVIAVGVVGALKHKFRHIGWIIPILVGVTFLLRDFAPWFQFRNLIWPIAIIAGGLFIIFHRSRRHRKHYEHCGSRRYRTAAEEAAFNASPDEDFIEYNAIFGAVKKNIISKHFRGGEVNAVFGGVEINLMQAELAPGAKLELNAIFGGVKLIVPAHWQVKKSEITAVMGGVEDKRDIHKDILTTEAPILLLDGNAVMGGIEISSF